MDKSTTDMIDLYPKGLEDILKAEGIPENEIKGTIDLLTFSLIAHL